MSFDRTALQSVEDEGHALTLMMYGVRGKQRKLTNQMQSIVDADALDAEHADMVADARQTARELCEELEALQELLTPAKANA